MAYMAALSSKAFRRQLEHRWMLEHYACHRLLEHFEVPGSLLEEVGQLAVDKVNAGKEQAMRRQEL